MGSYKLIIEDKIKKEDLEKLIFGFGFEKDYLNDRYFYFDTRLSIKGCWVSFLYNFTNTTCVVTTFENRSYHDVEMQINVLKSIQEKFSGIVLDNFTGERINLENNVMPLTDFEIVVKRTYLYFLENINRVEMLVEEVDEKKFDVESRLRIEITNPSIIRNNTLIPFCVSILEDFLRTIFNQYLIFNEEKIYLYFEGRKGEMSYSSVKALLTGEEKLIDKILEDYSFQNFNSTNKAFQKYMDIKLFDILRTEVQYLGSQNVKLISVLEELIEMRHKIIHEAALHGKLSEKKMYKYCHFLKQFGNVFMRVFEEKNGLRIN